MGSNGFCRILSAAMFLLTTSAGLQADQAEDEAAIRSAAKSYVEAFNRHDAKGVAAHWVPDAVYQNPISGEEVTGRGEIEKQLSSIFAASKEIKLQVDVTSVQFVSPHVAIEEGIARVLRGEEVPDETRYSAVHIKSGGKWLIDRMTEQPLPIAQSNYEQLKELEWMIGTWVDHDDSATVETTGRWTRNQTYIFRTFKVSVADKVDFSGIQLIGWDAAEKRIRSWVFDSDGGFGEGLWTKRDNRWVQSARATLPDGRKSTAVNIMTRVDDDTMTWESTGRELDGQILPSIKAVQIKRQTKSEKE